LTGFALRLYHLGAESLWYDETVSVFLSRQQLAALIAHTAGDIHPPGYYLTLHLWQRMADPTLGRGLEFLFAWPSLWWGMLLLPLIYVLGRKLFNDRIALLALWLTAVHPYHLWYSQEVRMYTMGAALGLLCLWAVLKGQWTAENDQRGAEHGRQTIRSRLLCLAVYVIAAAAGLYTLYYFALLLIVLNLLVLLGLSRQHARRRLLFSWIMAQLAVALLWLPWMSTFWRQITEPPVPPWRGAVPLLEILRQSLSALLVGQSPPMENEWIWAGLTGLLLIVVFAGYAKTRQASGVALLLLYNFGPLLLIYLLSIWVTPLYHIRYFFIYAAPIPLLLALSVNICWRQPGIFIASIVVLLLISGWSATEFWTDPAYSADDHRSAVADLAAAWRPGDAILVNAGWVYPILEIYWPEAPYAGSVPPPLANHIRLIDYTDPSRIAEDQTPRVITTGSVDGSASLGWGSPDSDFYAISQPEARAALVQVAQSHPRIWHYRLYDTVSDPFGLLRRQLEEVGDLYLDRPYPGRDFLRLQLYETSTAQEPSLCPTSGSAVEFDDALRLLGMDTPVAATPGRFFYTTLCWEALDTVAIYPEGLRTSLRLYPSDAGGETLVVQADTAPPQPTTVWQPGERHRQPLALPLPAEIAPGQYILALVVYDGRDGTALTITDPNAIYGQIWPLSTVTIQTPTTK
jgi:hypothetical protein